MTATLTGRRMVVTGGGHGIGAAVVAKAVEQGASVAVLDRNLDAAAAVAVAAGREVTISGRIDVADEHSVASAFGDAVAQLGGLDIVVNAAGVMRGQHRDVRELETETWAEVIAINLTGSFLVSREAARHLVPLGDGVIVLVASRAGVLKASGSIAYGASKGGVHGLALSLARQLDSRGIRVHAVLPGDVDTPLMRASLAEAAENGASPEAIERLRSRLRAPEDVATAITTLVSPLAATVSGTVTTV